MDLSDIVKKFENVEEKAKQLFQNANHRSHGWLEIIASAVSQTLKPITSISAAALAYYALFSLFPLLLVTTRIPRHQFSQIAEFG